MGEGVLLRLEFNHPPISHLCFFRYSKGGSKQSTRYRPSHRSGSRDSCTLSSQTRIVLCEIKK